MSSSYVAMNLQPHRETIGRLSEWIYPLLYPATIEADISPRSILRPLLLFIASTLFYSSALAALYKRCPGRISMAFLVALAIVLSCSRLLTESINELFIVFLPAGLNFAILVSYGFSVHQAEIQSRLAHLYYPLHRKHTRVEFWEVYKCELVREDFGYGNACVAVVVYQESSHDTGDVINGNPKPRSPGDKDEGQTLWKSTLLLHNVMSKFSVDGPRNDRITIYPLARSSINSLTAEKSFPTSLTEIVINMAELISEVLDLMHVGYLDPSSESKKELLGGGCVVSPERPTQCTPKLSVTPAPRRSSLEDFTVPEGDGDHARFDVWSLGCVFAEILMFASGLSHVTEISQYKKPFGVIAPEFAHVLETEDPHENSVLGEELLSKLNCLDDSHFIDEPLIFAGSVRIIRLLLNPEPAQRPSLRESEMLLRALVGEDVQKCHALGTSMRPHIRVLLASFTSSD